MKTIDDHGNTWIYNDGIIRCERIGLSWECASLVDGLAWLVTFGYIGDEE